MKPKPYIVFAEPGPLVAERGVKPLRREFDTIEAARECAAIARRDRYVNTEGGRLSTLAFRYARVRIEDAEGNRVT